MADDGDPATNGRAGARVYPLIDMAHVGP